MRPFDKIEIVEFHASATPQRRRAAEATAGHAGRGVMRVRVVDRSERVAGVGRAVQRAGLEKKNAQPLLLAGQGQSKADRTGADDAHIRHWQIRDCPACDHARPLPPKHMHLCKLAVHYIRRKRSAAPSIL
ncbi:hypothetical protein [Ensifer sp. BR816]|uniref:hypothetical protein n=1 Tax=Rhizobium sp. (strain BR816) TaxID=1057002 RepID=UPI00036602EB|nr:hypothetical protein [Ensifer sp. BR816]